MIASKTCRKGLRSGASMHLLLVPFNSRAKALPDTISSERTTLKAHPGLSITPALTRELAKSLLCVQLLGRQNTYSNLLQSGRRLTQTMGFQTHTTSQILPWMKHIIFMETSRLCL